MLNTYSEIVAHPMFYVIIALTALIYGVQWATSLPIPKLRINQGWLRQNYVWLILAAVGGLFVCAMLFYLVEVAWSLRGVVDRLGDTLKTPDADTEDLRNLAYAIGALIAVLAGSATIFFSSIKVWINERTTTATEQGLITDRINKAVEGLGAEKVAVRQARTIEVRIDDHGSSETRLQLLGAEYPVESHETVTEKGKWEKVERNEPNIEVRIGSILALERLATQNLDFHIQIMEILCAYVRHNAPVEHATVFPEHGLRTLLHTKWEGGTKPRSDIETALKSIGRRPEQNRALENAEGFTLDLRECNLQNAILLGSWDNANFAGSNMVQADLKQAQLDAASFRDCDLSKTAWGKAKRQNLFLRLAVFARTQFSPHSSAGLQVLIGADDLMGSSFKHCLITSVEFSTELHAANLKTTHFKNCLFTHSFSLSWEQPHANQFHDCALKGIDCSYLPELPFSRFFGDGSVTMPDGTERPAHWPVHDLDKKSFRSEWKKWRDSKEGYTPPQEVS